ncbi:MAG: hypothetical protein ACI909_002970 [Planctomycetota bacterium]|jgi:hypothetical protein
MPITPFHFGPAAFTKSVTGGYFSFVAFGFTQVLIDLEPLFYMSQGLWPIHRLFHTYLGSTVVALLVIFPGKPICEAVLRFWNSRLSDTQMRLLSVKAQISLIAAGVGALFGAYSHVFFDSIMHSDMRPLAPFSDENHLLYIVSIDQLHQLCLVFGVVGGFILLMQLAKKMTALNRDE